MIFQKRSHIDIDKTQPGFPNDTCLRSRLCRSPNSENVKLDRSLEPYGDFLIKSHTQSSSKDFPIHVPFSISRGVAEVQIVKK